MMITLIQSQNTKIRVEQTQVYELISWSGISVSIAAGEVTATVFSERSCNVRVY